MGKGTGSDRGHLARPAAGGDRPAARPGLERRNHATDDIYINMPASKWLPTTKKEAEFRGWDELDVVLFSVS